MYLELRTWKGSWFGGEPAVHTRPFGHSEVPPAQSFRFAASLWHDDHTVAAHHLTLARPPDPHPDRPPIRSPVA